MSNIQSSMRNTLALLETVESGGGSYLLEGAVKQVAADLADLSDNEFWDIYKKTKAEVRKGFSQEKKEEVKEAVSTYSIEEKPCPVCKEKELTYNQGANHLSCGGCGTGFSQTSTGKWRKDKESVKEGISNSDEDPNLHKAYMLGSRAYQAYKNDPERAQAAQDKIESEFPQYLKMWTRGYRDSERFDKQAVAEDSDPCWKDYKQVGMKNKNGKKVPNCVPKEGERSTSK